VLKFQKISYFLIQEPRSKFCARGSGWALVEHSFICWCWVLCVALVVWCLVIALNSITLLFVIIIMFILLGVSCIVV